MANSPARPRASTEVATPDVDDITDAVLYASRVLVSVAARSLAAVADEVTLVQYRTLVVLSARGEQSLGELAGALGIHTSTATRMCDRLVGKQLLHRRQGEHDRREVVLELTTKGRRLVADVTTRRRTEIEAIVRRIPRAQRQALVEALTAFGQAAGEVPEAAWSLGWEAS
jgi:DNA-binding MarR family transcriptional regulator